MTLLQEINRLGTTVLVVTHEQNLVDQFVNRVITIDDGLISSDRLDGHYEYENQ
jgi:cell division transport system ATP-binding protein